MEPYEHFTREIAAGMRGKTVAAFFDFDGTVQGVGDVSDDDGLDELAFGEFLSSRQVARDAEGNIIRDAEGNLVFVDNPDSPFDVSAGGVAVINGTAGDFLSDGTATNRVFDFGDLINGQGAFCTALRGPSEWVVPFAAHAFEPGKEFERGKDPRSECHLLRASGFRVDGM